ncbi:MAG: hypothetical protein WC080_03285 [Patescibacteria group bacterium]
MATDAPNPSAGPPGQSPEISEADQTREQPEGGNEGQEGAEPEIDHSGEVEITEQNRPSILEATKRMTHENKSHSLDKREVFAILLNHISDENLNSYLIEKIYAILKERYGESAPSSSALTETAIFIARSEALFQDSDAAISELSKNPEYSGVLSKKTEILYALSLPIINGHLTANDVCTLVQNVEISDSLEDESRASAGYEGIMSFGGGVIKLSRSALKDNFATSEGKILSLDFVQMIDHEISHGIVAVAKHKESEADEENANSPIEISLREAKEIIRNAKDYIDFQPQHVRNVIKSLEKSEYNSLSPTEKAKWGSEEKFTKSREIMAAEEIVTDYTAIYLQSDGSFLSFLEVCLKKLDPGSFSRFSSSELGISESDTDQSGEISTKYAEIAEGIAGGNFSIEKLRTEHPGISRAIESYLVFYNTIKRIVQSEKGHLGEDFDGLDLDSMGYYDGWGGFDKQNPTPESQASSTGLLAVGGAFLGALANETNILSPIE